LGRIPLLEGLGAGVPICGTAAKSSVVDFDVLEQMFPPLPGAHQGLITDDLGIQDLEKAFCSSIIATLSRWLMLG